MYTIEYVLQLEENILKSDNVFVSSDIINHIYTLEYKFKDKRMNNTTKIEIPIKFEDIRVNLNKLSKKTYDIHFKYIISSIHCLHTDNPDLFMNVYNHISCNNFMVEPYSKLSASLIQIFPEFEKIFYNKIKTIYSLISDMQSNNPSTYDELCNINKIKDNIKSNILFFCHTLIILKNHTEIYTAINTLQTTLTNNLLDTTKKEQNELISELIFILIKNSFYLIHDPDISTNIIKHIETILNKKSDTSVSRKIIFNHMDMQDISKKTT